MKKSNINKKRYIYDPLYGVVYLKPYIWEIIPSPELQRLREVRLCNTNSLCLTGANINRYEHSIGTYHLAQECLNSKPPLNIVTAEEERQFLLAALLHDIASAAFGHSVEYIESKDGFDHERSFEYALLREEKEGYPYKQASTEPIFFGMFREIISKISENDIKTIGKIIRGETRFGILISGSMDLDNIDNVFRLAYHVGLIKSGETPIKLARSLWMNEGKLLIKKEAIPLVKEWYEVRKKLYELLLLNPEEFSIKCMLTEAIQISKENEDNPFRWYFTDYELLQHLSKVTQRLSKVTHETSEIIPRLMKGDLYGCLAIFSSEKIDQNKDFLGADSHQRLEKELSERIQKLGLSPFKSALIGLHLIVDVNKTQRQITVQTDEGETVEIGASSKQLLIGVFFKNKNLDIYGLENISEEVLKQARDIAFTHISNVLEDKNLINVQLYNEIESE
jgi:hypothetical protein